MRLPLCSSRSVVSPPPCGARPSPPLWRCSAAALALLFAVAPPQPWAQAPARPELDNRPDRLEWFRDQGLGLFLHWSVDSQLGVIISHSLAGASEDYTTRFYRDLPRTFDPTHFDPAALARLARVAGFRYMVFTTKHHNGFCMWPTKTEPFNITNTPYRKDIVGPLFDAFRAEGLAAGVYFSPDDFHWLHEHGIAAQRLTKEVQPSANPGLLALDKAQVDELMTGFGRVDVAFFDGEAQGLRDIVWQRQPEAVVTRGAIETPEQDIPGAPLPGAWESNMTVGAAWGYQPVDDDYKSSLELIRTLIRTRARGGNLLLNVGLAADGSLPAEQESRIRTLGSWMFVNGEAIYGARPWVVTNEGDLWFTRSKQGDTVYVIVDDADPGMWKRGTAREFVLKTVRASATTQVDVLGQSSEVVEYRPELRPQGEVRQAADGLHVHVMRAQRLRDSDRWPYPTVLRLTHVSSAFVPPVVHTEAAVRGNGNVRLRGSWSGGETAPGTTFSFDVRVVTGEDTRSRLHAWEHLPTQPAERPGEYTATFTPQAGESYEIRAVLHHPLLTLYGEPVTLQP